MQFIHLLQEEDELGFLLRQLRDLARRSAKEVFPVPCFPVNR
jgi:hypothetical protein